MPWHGPLPLGPEELAEAKSGAHQSHFQINFSDIRMFKALKPQLCFVLLSLSENVHS